jgi:hypothetical protein
MSGQLFMRMHVCPNVWGENSTLKAVYTKHRALDIMTENAQIMGVLYNVQRSNPTFLTQLVSENPNVLWSYLTLLTYYLIRFAKREIEASVARHENMQFVRAPEVVVTTWYGLVKQLGQRLGRPLSWYDLLYANNFYDCGGRLEPLLTVMRADGAPSDVNEVNFMRAMTMLGGYRDAVVQGYFEAYRDDQYLTNEFFNAYYVRYLNLLGRIHGLNRGQLSTISCMFPIAVLNEHFAITKPQEERLLNNGAPS